MDRLCSVEPEVNKVSSSVTNNTSAHAMYVQYILKVISYMEYLTIPCTYVLYTYIPVQGTHANNNLY
jgi:hypothetical protein